LSFNINFCEAGLGHVNKQEFGMLYKSRKEFHKFILKWPLIVRLWFSTYDVVHRLTPEHPLHMFLA